MDLKKILCTICGFVLLQSTLQSQNNINNNFEYIDTLIKNQKYDIADKKLDEILSVDKNNSTALMFKGVVIFYRESVSVNEDSQAKNIENIYEPDYEKDSVENTSLSPESAQKIAFFFEKALEIDPKQMNVQLGLCYAYAKAGMIDELISRFPELKKYGNDQDKMQNNMSEYAHIIAHRKTLNEGLKIFSSIQSLYPDDGNVLYQLGMLYFENGHIQEALDRFHDAEKFSKLEPSVLENLLLMYSITGDYNRVIQTANKMSQSSKDKSELLYKALEERLENNSEWTKTLNEYSRHSKSPKNIKSFVSSLRKSTKINTYDNFLETAQFNVPASMLAMNYEYGLKQYPDQFEILFNYAEFLTYYNHYNKALVIFKRILDKKINMNNSQREEFNFYYAWALHQSGQYLKSQQYWKRLLNSGNFYKKSAASYFLGRYYFNKRDYDQAVKYFSYVKDKPEKSKYAEFCQNMFKRIQK